ncbi:class A sortase [Enterococcus lemanii]|jgi:sortase A|uniref:Class A sortase n=1 Tax=Enterococcus lemanii TaxID=1159752 RepID=A0ABV9MRM8_9ENTE|nr:class A sortase [Enterococcus lemanii]MBM7708487.1 sortase A [Enterococcus lemanii]
MKKKRLKNILINLGLFLLLLLGLALVFNRQIKQFLMSKTSARYQIEQVTREQIEANKQVEATFDFAAVESASLEAVLQAQLSGKVLPVIGGIAVPSVEIQLPIFKGLGNEALLFGAGTFSPEQQMGQGNYALASHRIEQSTILFTRLEEVKMGDVIYLTDLDQIYVYETIESKRIEAYQVEVIEEVPDQTLVTLITCGEAAGITRWMVQGKLTETIPVDKATPAMLEAFSMTQQTF